MDNSIVCVVVVLSGLYKIWYLHLDLWVFCSFDNVGFCFSIGSQLWSVHVSKGDIVFFYTIFGS